LKWIRSIPIILTVFGVGYRFIGLEFMGGLYKRIALTLVELPQRFAHRKIIIFHLETHHHFTMYQHQSMGQNLDAAKLDFHFEESAGQSIIWISISGLLISIIVSLYVAKELPLAFVGNEKQLGTNGKW
jgi:hypothetical protein